MNTGLKRLVDFGVWLESQKINRKKQLFNGVKEYMKDEEREKSE
jgi:hypothetical protein